MKKLPNFVMIIALCHVLAGAGPVWALGSVYQSSTGGDSIELTNIDDPGAASTVIANEVAQESAPPSSQAVVPAVAGPSQAARNRRLGGARQPDAVVKDEDGGDGATPATEVRAADAVDAASKGGKEAGGIRMMSATSIESLGGSVEGQGAGASNAGAAAAAVAGGGVEASDTQLQQYRDLMVQKANSLDLLISGNPAVSRRYTMPDRNAYMNSQ